MDRQLRPRVWFFDDLGKMRWLPTTEGVFFDIVETRMRDQKIILVTTTIPARCWRNASRTTSGRR